LRKDRNNRILEYSSVIIRVHDNQREWIPPKGYYGDLNNSYLPQDKLQKWSFLEKRERDNTELAKTFVPSQLSKDTFRISVNMALGKVSFQFHFQIMYRDMDCDYKN
jgi:hypothetical protein